MIDRMAPVPEPTAEEEDCRAQVLGELGSRRGRVLGFVNSWQQELTLDTWNITSLGYNQLQPGGPGMTEVEPVLDFASSGRSGRRNALPDILGSPAGVNPGDLPLKLAELSLEDGPGEAQSPAAEEPPAPPESSEGKEGS